MVKNVTYGQLRKVLLSLGCEGGRAPEGHFVFTDPRSDLVILMPGGTDRQHVRPMDLRMVQHTLVGYGIIPDGEYDFDSLFLIRKGDRLIWTDPNSRTETKVTAAAGESDGLVVIKQNGTLLPCPVDQVTRIKRAAPAGRK